MASNTDHAPTSVSIHDSSLRKRIMRQVEFYLSEGNLTHDRFFAEQMKQRPDNGIPIVMLLQCHRLQALNINEELLLRSIKKSSLVKVSEDGLALIRAHPLTELAPREKRTVLVVGVPRWLSDPDSMEQSEAHQMTDVSEASVSVPSESTQHDDPGFELREWLRDIFSEFGEVLYISLPHFHSSGLFRGFAFVEFASPKQARLAAKSMGPTAEGESWFVTPVPDGSSSTAAPLTENAWKPRLAARTALPETDMLARRYVWRCCSRKNKQIQVAFRHLRSAGYRAPNPCDREYELITLGASSPEVRAQHIKEGYGEPHRDKLRVLRYPVWEFWKSKFYIWLHAWVERMRRKTDELSMNFEAAQLDMEEHNEHRDAPTVSNLIAEKVDTANSVQEDAQSQINLNLSDTFTSLPKNYVPNSVVLLFWPSKLVPEFRQAVHPSDQDSEPGSPVLKPHLTLARRIRISLERHLLSTCNLLDQVAHMDPHPNELVLSEVLTVLDKKEPEPSRNPSDETYAVFIRMKTKAAALLILQSIPDLKLSVTIDPIRSHLLSGESEVTYCKAISASLTGAAERRRRVQFKRRQRKKTEPGNMQQIDGFSTPVQHRDDLPESVSMGKRPKHIVFDE